MFGDQPEAADLGRKCEICRVGLETDLPWCQFCTRGEASLWERIEQLKIGSGARTVMSILTDWSQQLPGWNLQQGLEMLLKPSNRRSPRTTQPKRAPFVVVEGNRLFRKDNPRRGSCKCFGAPTLSGKGCYLSKQFNPIGEVPEAYFADGITNGMLDTTDPVLPS